MDKTKKSRPTTGYILFCSENRERVKQSLPKNFFPADVMKKLSEEWRSLTEVGQQTYKNKATAYNNNLGLPDCSSDSD